MRRIIAALQVSLDGFIEGPNGELDWVDSWEDPFDLRPQIDTCILGAGMYPGYEQYWGAIAANPNELVPFFDRLPAKGEIEYAEFASRTQHVVLSRTMHEVAWRNTRIVRELESIRELKALPGKDMHAVGGASLVGSLINAGLVDELRLVVQPVLLGGGKALFKDVNARHALRHVATESAGPGQVRLTYAA